MGGPKRILRSLTSERISPDRRYCRRAMSGGQVFILLYVFVCLLPNGVGRGSYSYFGPQLRFGVPMLPCVHHACPSVPPVSAECLLVGLCSGQRVLSVSLTTSVFILLRWEHGRVLSRRVKCCDLGSKRVIADASWM